jgi:hypothetical protein
LASFFEPTLIITTTKKCASLPHQNFGNWPEKLINFFVWPYSYHQVSKSCLSLSVYFVCFRMAAGTAHGFVLFDYAQKKPIASRCTLNPGQTKKFISFSGQFPKF